MKKVLDGVLLKIKLSEQELKDMNSGISEFVGKIENNIKKKKIKASVFIGGSSGKGTVVKRKKQDIDIFVRFDKENDIFKLGKVLVGKIKKIHGSRDYFKVYFNKLNFEIVPVFKISKPELAKNVTDLSYFHVSYVKKKIKQKKIQDDIMLAKSFCYAQNCYGAESYIKGFSGYALELLIIYYGSFEKMIRSLIREKPKIIIDTEKHYKNKKEVMEEMNEAKLISPIIFVDPTYRERNALSSLSYETFFKFQKACREFIKKPDEKFFFPQKINKKNFNLILKAKTSRQEGDIAGSKLYKFFSLVLENLEKNFVVEKKEFEYDDNKSALFYFKIKLRKNIIISGPPVSSLININAFRKKHKKVFIKKGRIYAREKSLSVKKFLSEFKNKNKRRMRDMGIKKTSFIAGTCF